MGGQRVDQLLPLHDLPKQSNVFREPWIKLGEYLIDHGKLLGVILGGYRKDD